MEGHWIHGGSLGEVSVEYKDQIVGKTDLSGVKHCRRHGGDGREERWR